MKYYKIIVDDCFIGIATSADFIKFQKKHNILLSCKESEAQFILFNNVLYRASWMISASTSNQTYKNAEVIEISDDEYKILVSGEDVQGEEILSETIDNNELPVIVDNIEKATIEYVKEQKIASLRKDCDNAILNGVDVILADGFEYHFSMTIQDQLNLNAICSMIERGETNIIYHADGEPYRQFSNQEILDIVTAAYNNRVYQTVYYSCLKEYVNSLDNMIDVNQIVYGVAIPENFQSETLKAMYV